MHNAIKTTMNKRILTPIFISFFFLTFIQCKKCDPKELGVAFFSQTDLNIVPYIGTETLIFKDSIGDTIGFKPSEMGRENSFRHWHERTFVVFRKLES